MQASETQIFQNQGGLFEKPSWKYRETVLQRRNAAGQETGSMAVETLPLQTPFDSSWLQQKRMDLTSQQGTAFQPIISLLNLSFYKAIKCIYMFTSNILGRRIFPILMSESIFLSFGLIVHLRWHQRHLTFEWLRIPHNKEREARVWELPAIGKPSANKGI